jgi:Bacterial Ig-like domain (group 3)
LEQVHVTGMNRRKLRLNRMAWLGLALSFSLLPSGAIAQTAATRTTLSVSSTGQPIVTVTDVNNDSAAAGVVNFEENGRILGQSLLNAQGQATASFTLPAGAHDIQAIYAGDASHRSSISTQATIQPQATTTAPGYQLSLTPVSPSALPMTLTAGQTGSLNVSVIPVNNASLTGPLFVTLSCAGLPSLASCSFAPENVPIVASTPTSCPAGSPAAACPPVSLMVISTQAAAPGGSAASNRTNSPVLWAILLPGILGLGGFAWGARRRRWLQRIALVAMLGFVTVLGTTGCSPLYRYYNHGPILSPQTPTGNYTVTITAQSSDGVTSSSNSTTMVLTVN